MNTILTQWMTFDGIAHKKTTVVPLIMIFVMLLPATIHELWIKTPICDFYNWTGANINVQ